MRRGLPSASALLALAACQTVVSFDDVVERGVQCVDGVDNDGDGRFDCADPACTGVAACNGCGNGRVEADEQCDDGNPMPDDGCGPDCRFDPCGNGVLDPGEVCDDGNRIDTDECPTTCQEVACGDGFVRASLEECDDGNEVDTDACPTTCVNARCGDGFVQAGVEQCDDYNLSPDDGCAGCVIERCGDGVTQNGLDLVSIELSWLASSCAGPADLRLRLTNALGQSYETTVQADVGTCTCRPEGGFRSSFITDRAALDVAVNGPMQVTVDFAGAGHFLAWARVDFRAEVGGWPVVVHEGAPGAALSQVTSLCSGGFDENIPVTTVTAVVPLLESCDDGNPTDGDGCERTCRVSP